MIHGNRSPSPWLSEFLNIKIRNPRSLLPAPHSHNSHPRAGIREGEGSPFKGGGNPFEGEGSLLDLVDI
jgi:hypothetical protein